VIAIPLRSLNPCVCPQLSLHIWLTAVSFFLFNTVKSSNATVLVSQFSHKTTPQLISGPLFPSVTVLRSFDLCMFPHQILLCILTQASSRRGPITEPALQNTVNPLLCVLCHSVKLPQSFSARLHRCFWTECSVPYEQRACQAIENHDEADSPITTCHTRIGDNQAGHRIQGKLYDFASLSCHRQKKFARVVVNMRTDNTKTLPYPRLGRQIQVG
jgi:hypothetical protein